jgi:anaphase-promoting complex subunit 8
MRSTAFESYPAVMLFSSVRRSAELLTQIDLTASSTSTSAMTSAMASRVASHQKVQSNSAARAASMASGARGGLAPPSFDEIALGGAAAAASSAHVPHRRQTITQQLFKSPGPATPNTFQGAATPAVSAFPLLTTPQSHQRPTAQQDTAMHDTPPLHFPTGPSSSIRRKKLFLPASLQRSPEAWDELTYARSLFDLKEFARAAHVLRDVPLTDPMRHNDEAEDGDAELESGPNGNANQCLFVRCYSLYLAGEKRKEEELLEKRGRNGMDQTQEPGAAPGEQSTVVNRELRGLQSVLSVVLRRDSTTVGPDGLPLPTSPYARFHADGFLWFLYGLVLRDLGLKSAGRQALLHSCLLFPWNWSAWQALAAGMGEKRHVEEVMAWMSERLNEAHAALERAHTAAGGSSIAGELPAQPCGVYMKEFFYCDVLIQLQSNSEDDSLAVLEQLTALFPDSLHTRSASAMAYYNSRRFPEAQHLFGMMREVDPWRWENMDTYSNMLYVLGDNAALSSLAHAAWKADKYRLQTQCIVGNYYSSRGERERAVVYFKRALLLHPSYLSAWTLLGHEYVELRQTNLAIEAYRKAVEINPRDYRAWYGLGQTYEILSMNSYSLYYFRRASSIKPTDPRMWCAIGENLEKLAMEGQEQQRLEEAIRCYLRAEAHEDVEGVALNKLAQLYRRKGQLDQAAKYYRKVLQRHSAELPIDASPTASVAASSGGAAAMDISMTSSTGSVPALNRSSSSQMASGALSNPSGGVQSGLGLHADAVDAMLFLAEYEFKHHATIGTGGRAVAPRLFATAEAYCNRLLDVATGPSKDAAKSLLMEIRALKQHLNRAGAPASANKRVALAPFTPVVSSGTPAQPQSARSTGFFDSPN